MTTKTLIGDPVLVIAIKKAWKAKEATANGMFAALKAEHGEKFKDHC